MGDEFTAVDARKRMPRPDSTAVFTAIGVIVERIKRRAEAGHTELVYPFDRIDDVGRLRPDHGGYPHLSQAARNVVTKVMEDRGFRWVYRASQDPGHPGDRPYEAFEW